MLLHRCGSPRVKPKSKSLNPANFIFAGLGIQQPKGVRMGYFHHQERVLREISDLFPYFILMKLLHLKDREALDRPVITRMYSIGGKNITFESGRLALFAHGAAVISDESGNFLLTTTGIG